MHEPLAVTEPTPPDTASATRSSPAHHLRIEARSPSIDPATPLLGLSLLRRLVLAARRAGFDTIEILAADAGDAARLSRLVQGVRGVSVTAEGAQPSAGCAVVAADVLGEVAPLEALARGETSAVFRIVDDATLEVARDRLLRALVKATDGFMSRHFARPISIAVSRRIVGWGVTPNQMTIVSMLIGLVAAPFFLFDAPWLQAIGGLLFVAHSVLDGCDGELARLTYRESRLGGLLDFIGDNLVHVAVFGCMGWGWYAASGSLWPLYLGISAVLGAAGSALAVYWLTLRKTASGGAATGPLYTSVAASPQRSARLTKMLDDLSRRDFIYLVFVLSLFGKASWFLALAGIGAPIFLMLVLFVARREGRG